MSGATARQLVYRLHSVSYPKRMAVLVGLGLLLDGDETLSNGDLIRRVVERARERKIADQLEREIEDALR